MLEIALNLTVEEILKKLFDIVGIEYTAIHPKYLAYLKELIDYETGYVVTMNRMIVGKDNLHLYVQM